MDQTIAINSVSDIPASLRGTPIGLLLEYHNLDRPYDTYSQAQMLVGMCIDNRKHLHMPDNFSYIIRAGGANLKGSEFKISYAIGVGGVSHIALIGHNNCGMVNLMARKKLFVDGLVERAGWTTEQAEEYFTKNAPMSEINNEIDFILFEVKRLREKYPKVKVVPMLFKVEDSRLYLLRE